jgi:hypothetical protein
VFTAQCALGGGKRKLIGDRETTSDSEGKQLDDEKRVDCWEYDQ